MKHSFLALTAMAVMLLSACGATPQDATNTSQAEPVAQDNPTNVMSDFNQTAAPEKGEQIVVMETNHGTIKIKLFPDMTPKTVENFVGLIEKDYYNGIIFHRVIKDFMIQGGDPNGTGTGGESVWGGKFEDEFDDNLTHLRGALSMANAGPGTNGSQFFIVHNEAGTPFLDGRHSVFGQVFEGMEVVDKIANVETLPGDRPKEEVVMEKVTVEKY